MRHFFARSLILLTAALPLSAALDFSGSGNRGTFGMSPSTFNFTPSGGSGNYTFSYAPLTAPIPGFRVMNTPEASSGGGLTGVPLTTGLQSATIRLTDNSNSTFIDHAVSFTISPVDLAGFMPSYFSIGDTVNQKFWPVGGSGGYTYTLSGTLPPGLSLTSQIVNGVNVAVVGGTILNTANTATSTASNAYGFTITIKDSVGNSLGRGYSTSVSAMQLQVNGAPLNSGANRFLPPATVGLAYSQQISVVGGTPPYTFTLEPLNSTPNTISLSSGGLLSGTPTGSTFGGRFTFDVTDAANHFLSVRVALYILPTTPVPLTLGTNLIGDSGVGSNDNWGIYSSGGLPPYTFDIDPATPLPAGAFLVQGPELSPGNDPDPAYLRVRIQSLGTFNFIVRVTDSAGNHASRPYTLTTRALTSTAFPRATYTLGIPVSQYLVPQGGTPPYTVTPVNIPAGLTIDNNGLLSGTPQEAGNFLPFIYTLTDTAGNQFTQVQGNIIIASTTSPGLSLSGGDLGVTRVGVQFASNLTANSTQSPPVFTVSLVSGTLPPGMRLLTAPDFSNNGNTTIAAQLAGIPTTPGTYTFVYRVVDGFGQVGQRQIKLRVTGMEIVNTAIVPGTVGVPYGPQTFDLRGGVGPFTWSLTTGNLPTGLSFNTTNGTISGTPLTSASVGITVQVQSSTGEILQRGYGLNIYPIQITGPDVLPTGFFGQNYNYTFTPSPAGSYTFTASGIPNGTSINSSTGVLSGIVNTTGTFNITITAFNNATGAIVTRSFTLFVPSWLNFINGLPTAEISVGGVPTAYLGAATVGASFITTLGFSGGAPPYTVTLVGGSLPPGLSLAIGSTLQGTTNFGRWVIAGVPATPGVYSFRLRFADSAGLFEERTECLNIVNYGLATTTLGIGKVNQPYAAQLYGVGGGGAFTFALSPDVQNNVMPPGLTLSPTGLVNGTPTSTGSFGVNIDVTSGALTRRVGINITIDIDATSDFRRIDFGLGPLINNSTAGRAAVLTLNPNGIPSTASGTYTWSLVAGALPPGMQLLTGSNLPSGFAAPTAVLSGAPTTPGTYSFRIRVDDSTGNFGIRDATWTITPMRLTPVNFPFSGNTVFPPGIAGQPYPAFTLGALNGKAPVVFATEPGTLLPAGLSLSSTGVLSGTPTDAGNFVLFARATDANGFVGRFSTGINVYPAGGPLGLMVSIGSGTVLPSATAGTGFTLVLNDFLSPGYGTAPFTWTLFDGTLPTGLSILPGSGLGSATLSGTPTVPGNYSFSLLASDSNGKSSLIRLLSLRVSVFGVSPPAGALPPAVAGTSYLTSVSASGGTSPYTFAKSYDSDMPPGLALDPSGVLSGTPNLAGPFVLFVNATDALGSTFRQRYTLSVSPVGTVQPAFTLTPASINLTYTIGDAAPPLIPVSVGSTSGALSYTASASGDSGGTWIGISPGSGTTPGAPNANINPIGLSVGTHNGTLTFTSSSASNSPANIPVTVTVSATIVCNGFWVNPTVGTPTLAAGGSQQFNVGFGPGSSITCPWAVDTASLPAWISLTSAASGTGSGTIKFTVAANLGTASRPGNITVNGVSYTLTQFGTLCSFTIAPLTSSLSAAGGSGGVYVTSSSTTCGWSTVNNPLYPWITAAGTLPPTVPPGSGTQMISVAANTSSSSRTGTITIAGQVYTVNQAGVGCSFNLSSTGTSVSSSGGPASFNVIAPAGCAWSADTGPSWISPSGPASGSGSGSVSLSISANSTTAQRSASVKVGSANFTVTQAGLPCSFSLSANNPVQPVGGGIGSVDITANAGCGWTASATSAGGWLTPASASGTGAGTFSFAAATNSTGASRSATLTIVGQSITVTQSGPVCAYSLVSSSARVPGAGSPGAIGVVTAAGCGPYTAVSNVPAWVHITDSGSYTGPQSANYSVDANLTGSDRIGTITIAGQPFTITQPALPCSITLTSAPTSLGEFGGLGQFTFTTLPVGCSVNVQSYSSWITVTDLSVPGTVRFSVAPNTYAAARSGSISVGDKTYQVDEAASSCAYTLTSFAAAFAQAGGPGAIPMTYAPALCGAPPVIVSGPAGMVTLGSVIPGAGTYTQNYSVAIYLSFINYIRATQLIVNGQIYTVKQTSW